MGGKGKQRNESLEPVIAGAESVSALLHRAHQLATDAAGATLEPLELTLRQYVVLAAVARAPGCSQTDLVAATGVDRSTLADIARRLEERGLVRRVRGGADRRERAVSVTQEGSELLTQAAPAVAAADRRLLAGLKRKRGLELTALLRELTTAEPRSPKSEKKAKANTPKAVAEKAKKLTRKRVPAA